MNDGWSRNARDRRRAWAGLFAALPVTSKDDLLRRQTEDPPSGGFCAVPIEDLGRVYVSPGPIYEPAGVWDDAGWMQELLARTACRAGAAP